MRLINKVKSLSNLQIIRGVASTSVVYFHIGNSPQFGAFGVDVFFVLSGFVIAMLVNNGQSPADFLIARLSRIIPLYWFMTIGLFLAALIAPSILNSATANLEQLCKSLFFVPFFRTNGDMYPLLGVGWTLNYEMLFYGSVFFSIFFCRRNWIQVTTLLFVGMYLLGGYVIEHKLINSFFGSCLIFEFLFGIYAFKIFDSQKLQGLPRSVFIVTGTLAYILMAVIESNGVIDNRLLLFGVPALLLILAAVELERKYIGTTGKVRLILASIGDASYATYLSHYFVVATFKRVLYLKLNWIDPNSVLGMLLATITALVIGQVIYKYLDKPMHRFFRKKFSKVV